MKVRGSYSLGSITKIIVVFNGIFTFVASSQKHIHTNIMNLSLIHDLNFDDFEGSKGLKRKCGVVCRMLG